MAENLRKNFMLFFSALSRIRDSSHQNVFAVSYGVLGSDRGGTGKEGKKRHYKVSCF